MRIDGSYGPEFTPRPADARSSPANRRGDSRDVPGAPKGSSHAPVEASHRPLVQRVLQTPEIDTHAVQAAKKLLDSAALDTPDAARRAAGKILEGGL